MDLMVSRTFLQRGIARLQRNEFVAAVADFDAAICYAPDDPYAHWNKAMALLSLGDYANGFVEYEWGLKLFNWRGFGPVKEDIDRLQALPMWKGEHHVRLLIYHEMGFGDAIMLMRYLPELARRAELTLVIDPFLHRLAQAFDVDVIDGVPKDLREYDYRLPFFGVMTALKETIETIPRAPYIAGGAWKFIADRKPRVGIAWSGRTQAMFSLSEFLRLLDCSNCELYSLQPGPVVAGVVPLSAGGDFADVADLIRQMDYIVTVDTAAAHLAGAMGHPSTHLMLPFMGDWRWWHAAAWYPTIKTYRQPTAGNDWHEPFVRLNVALRPQVTGDEDGRPKATDSDAGRERSSEGREGAGRQVG